MIEQWRDVVGWEGLYRISDAGGVLALARDVHQVRHGKPFTRHLPDRILRGSLITSGHRQVALTPLSGPPKIHRLVHHLVLEAFVGPCPPGLEALHYNDIHDDNQLSNLRWGTRSENQEDAVRNGVHGSVKKTRCPQNHPYDAENTYIGSRGERCCRQCSRDRCRAYRQRLRAVA